MNSLKNKKWIMAKKKMVTIMNRTQMNKQLAM